MFKRLLLLFLILSTVVIIMNPIFSQTYFPEIMCFDKKEKQYVDDSLFKREFRISDFKDSLEIFQQRFGTKKEIPSQIRERVLIALSFFPELAKTHIKFEYKPIQQTMNARPNLGNVFRKKQDKRYTVIINNNEGKYKGLPIDKLSFNIFLGWLGHELAHIIEYEKMTNMGTILFGIRYVFSSSYKQKVERYTDYLTIKHGLAFPLYDGVECLLNDNSIAEEYKQNMINNYLSLDEIKCIWEQNNFDKKSE